MFRIGHGTAAELPQDREYILHDADVQQPEAEPEAAGVAIAEAALDIDVDLPAGFLEGALKVLLASSS